MDLDLESSDFGMKIVEKKPSKFELRLKATNKLNLRSKDIKMAPENDDDNKFC